MFDVVAQAYGPTAWWWEVEELVRKLLLSAVVVLFDAGSPLQVSAGMDIVAAETTSGAQHCLLHHPPLFNPTAASERLRCYVCLNGAGHTGGPGQRLGARVARSVQTMGCRQQHVHAATW